MTMGNPIIIIIIISISIIIIIIIIISIIIISIIIIIWPDNRQASVNQIIQLQTTICNIKINVKHTIKYLLGEGVSTNPLNNFVPHQACSLPSRRMHRFLCILNYRQWYLGRLCRRCLAILLRPSRPIPQCQKSRPLRDLSSKINHAFGIDTSKD